jgi:hypothetical protein
MNCSRTVLLNCDIRMHLCTSCAALILLPAHAPDQVNLSVVEIYCERIQCLLDASKTNLVVKQDAQRGA